MTLGEQLIGIAEEVGWRMTPDGILVKKLGGKQEVCLDPLKASMDILSRCPTVCCAPSTQSIIEAYLLEAEGSAVLKLMCEEVDV